MLCGGYPLALIVTDKGRATDVIFHLELTLSSHYAGFLLGSLIRLGYQIIIC